MPRWNGLTALVLLLSCSGAASGGAESTSARNLSGQLPDGALWRIAVPAQWNGTLLLYSHGYARDVQAPALAPRGLEPWLLQHGYALAASSYARPGWAVAEAVPDQLATLDQFGSSIGKPLRTLAWGESMGGLITVALAEHQPARLDGALSACGSVGGSLAMMNMALDGAFAFKTLIGPDAATLPQAMTSPQGRARVALAAALGGLPLWSLPEAPQPAASDLQGQLKQVARTFAAGVFLPREDQEQRAGGRFSWNTGVNYRALLDRSGRRHWVAEYYRQAGVSLDADLETLNAAPRISADPQAVAYMRAHYVPDGELNVPLFSYHTLGDGLTSPILEGAYAHRVKRAGREANIRVAWVAAAGHCTFSPAEHLIALSALESRLQSGHWRVEPDQLNAAESAPELGPRRYVRYTPYPLPRD
jgi:pimeloyl-ACP methyl ester carboxylesterase